MAVAATMDDDAVLQQLTSLGADWHAAPGKLRALLQENGVHGISEKRLKRLKAAALAAVKAVQPTRGNGEDVRPSACCTSLLGSSEAGEVDI